jgi:hypothetical protein
VEKEQNKNNLEIEKETKRNKNKEEKILYWICDCYTICIENISDILVCCD